MIHPHTELRFISDDVGYGVVATQLILKGTIVWTLDKIDRAFTPAEFQAFDATYQRLLDTYCFRSPTGDFILCWDIGKYVNHSFKSSVLSTAYDFEIAIRDIQPGEELTDDYGYLNITEPFQPVDEGTERKWVYSDDLVRYHPVWDEQLRAAFPQVAQVEQPLRDFLSPSVWETARRVAAGEEEMASILKLYFDPDKVQSKAA